ncbi:hypothetical protein BJV78DRAFT_1287169 [Lactifluus subvellereus]|nr:hypothetical protein BJV78DRAFT_1289780 [Lactifluus subvellereus]KAI0245781.1 hypothetical protein BJV78DRAFT_1287169 [Lactifluus subvellereus]
MAATLLIDPIPFLLHYPTVAYNFVYRQPRRANEWQLWYFARARTERERGPEGEAATAGRGGEQEDAAGAVESPSRWA